ncbi:CDP-diacylglycerol--glycerol-3-phosphate 3-phosphatidyltransferase PgsA [Gottschalkia acidurici 9a]|uniref:CDP-diacylglycerol--glycerol-3-phosphate 3-phosphatidyltransferase PgsA n=1 Tax=Gottschalkia acidurici (strain ATCC 7906 / DSM 604 / BCRC 14475 / CIP 104303 / KCTC 5404 / NCIMB 10678 / 9a) TaxID=1128398 RepID=K0AXT3_GOTA9|nr:CDP-alcohol phosphatidyltransferase family protein [Gottschalkia acidurici]AFS77592.1 CDP-diacylglycerol--glycerol-3-phosphate 3-phosphatidyltransferase PgsA [Gottschalkia acidurici 9a]
MKYIPNLISFLRIILSFLMISSLKKPFFLITLLFLGGISDVADGYIARSFNVKSKLGAKLDSLADFFFFSVSLFVLLYKMKVKLDNYIFIWIIIIAAIKVFNLLLTLFKFKQLGSLHTIGNKLSGLALFIIIATSIALNNIHYILMIITGVLATLSSLEESILLLTMKKYSVNVKSILSVTDKYL